MTTAQLSTPSALPSIEQGAHYDLIKAAIPECLTKSSAERRLTLKRTRPAVPSWYAAACDGDKPPPERAAALA
ncbi:hypothetical protein OOJ96_07150 [Pseudomonas sp. 15FMM2]|uniref:Uncharacterized protein n=1 Tax=Pseudomonas imrae TaxID=2992837 RepID=A0ACC7PC17_9PSED